MIKEKSAKYYLIHARIKTVIKIIRMAVTIILLKC